MNANTGESLSPIVLAIRAEDLAAVQLLAKSGSFARQPSGSVRKDSSLPEAIFRGDASIVARLLDARIYVNSPNRGGNTALTAVIQAENKELLCYLLNKEVDINNPYTKQRGKTGLQAAVVQNDIEPVQYLLRVGIDANDPCALLAAVENNAEISITQMLLTAHSCLPGLGGVSYGVAAFHTAIKAADLEIFNILLDAGIDVNAVTLTAYKKELEKEMNEEESDVIYGEIALGTAVREDRGEGLPNNSKALECRRRSKYRRNRASWIRECYPSSRDKGTRSSRQTFHRSRR